MANNRQDINISEQWANASSNKIVVNEQEASLGITYQGPINSNQLNGLANWITRALSYQQNHSGLYNPLRQYNKGDSCFLLGLDSLNNYNLKMYICKRDADYPIANITPINAALQTLTLQGEVIYYYVILPDEVIVNEPWEEIVVGGDDRKFVYTRAELSYKDKTIEQEYTRTYTDTTGEVTEIVRGDSTTVYADYEQPQSIQASKIFVKGGRFGDLIVPNTQTVILSESTAPNIAVADPMIPNPTLIVKGSGLIDTDATMLVLNSSPDESQQAEYARRQGDMIQSTNQAQATGYTAGPLNSVSGLLATTANPKNFNSPLSKYEGIYISKRLEAGGSNFKICSTNSTYTTGSNSDELVTHKDLSRFVLPYISDQFEYEYARMHMRLYSWGAWTQVTCPYYNDTGENLLVWGGATSMSDSKAAFILYTQEVKDNNYDGAVGIFRFDADNSDPFGCLFIMPPGLWVSAGTGGNPAAPTNTPSAVSPSRGRLYVKYPL